MAKCKSLRDVALDPMEEVQETLNKQGKSLEYISCELLNMLNKYQEKVLNTSPKNSKYADERTARILTEVLQKNCNAIEKGQSSDSNDGVKQEIAAYLNFEKENFKVFLAGLKLPTPDTMRQEEVKTWSNTEQMPASPTAKDFYRWGFAYIQQWIDAHIGLRNIRRLFWLIAFFIWFISIGSAIFIVRENQQLRDTEEKYRLLRHECRKYQQTNEFVNKLELIFSDKAGFQQELHELRNANTPSKNSGKP